MEKLIEQLTAEVAELEAKEAVLFEALKQVQDAQRTALGKWGDVYHALKAAKMKLDVTKELEKQNANRTDAN